MLLVNFWSDWSIQCRDMSYVMYNIRTLLEDKDAIAYIDWHYQKELAQKLEVFGVPTLIIYGCGEELARFSGTLNEITLLGRVDNVKKKLKF